MVSCVVPLARYPKTYNGHPLQYAAVSSEKSYVSVHLMSIYADAESQRWFVDSYRATGKNLDMGKACVRFNNAGGPPAQPHRAKPSAAPPWRSGSGCYEVEPGQEARQAEAELGGAPPPSPSATRVSPDHGCRMRPFELVLEGGDHGRSRACSQWAWKGSRPSCIA